MKKIKKEKVIEWQIYKQLYRDMHASPFFEAICSHGVGHHNGVHGCDGCCKDAPKEIWKQVSKD